MMRGESVPICVLRFMELKPCVNLKVRDICIERLKRMFKEEEETV